MSRLVLLTVAVWCAAGCSSSETSSGTAQDAPPALQRAAEPRSQYAPVPKEEVFAILVEAGLDPTERAATRIPKSIREAIPEEPLQHFMLAVDQEGLIAFEFDSIYDAEQMEKRCDTGFRFKNWYFGGLVTVDLTNKLKRAFEV